MIKNTATDLCVWAGSPLRDQQEDQVDHPLDPMGVSPPSASELGSPGPQQSNPALADVDLLAYERLPPEIWDDLGGAAASPQESPRDEEKPLVPQLDGEGHSPSLYWNESAFAPPQESEIYDLFVSAEPESRDTTVSGTSTSPLTPTLVSDARCTPAAPSVTAPISRGLKISVPNRRRCLMLETAAIDHEEGAHNHPDEEESKIDPGAAWASGPMVSEDTPRDGGSNHSIEPIQPRTVTIRVVPGTSLDILCQPLSGQHLSPRFWSAESLHPAVSVQTRVAGEQSSSLPVSSTPGDSRYTPTNGSWSGGRDSQGRPRSWQDMVRASQNEGDSALASTAADEKLRSSPANSSADGPPSVKIKQEREEKLAPPVPPSPTPPRHSDYEAAETLASLSSTPPVRPDPRPALSMAGPCRDKTASINKYRHPHFRERPTSEPVKRALWKFRSCKNAPTHPVETRPDRVRGCGAINGAAVIRPVASSVQDGDHPVHINFAGSTLGSTVVLMGGTPGFPRDPLEADRGSRWTGSRFQLNKRGSGRGGFPPTVPGAEPTRCYRSLPRDHPQPPRPAASSRWSKPPSGGPRACDISKNWRRPIPPQPRLHLKKVSVGGPEGPRADSVTDDWRKPLPYSAGTHPSLEEGSTEAGATVIAGERVPFPPSETVLGEAALQPGRHQLKRPRADRSIQCGGGLGPKETDAQLSAITVLPKEVEPAAASHFARMGYKMFPLYPLGSYRKTAASPDAWTTPSLHALARLYKSGLPSSCGGTPATIENEGRTFLDYCRFLEFMLAHAPVEFFKQIGLEGIYFVENLTFEGRLARHLAFPAEGIVLINLTEVRERLNTTPDTIRREVLVSEVSSVLHELGHLCDRASDPISWSCEDPDERLQALLPSHRFPNKSDPRLEVTEDTRAQLPNRKIYAAASPAEFRAEAFADIFMAEGATDEPEATDRPRQRILDYWASRAQALVPAFHALICHPDGAFPRPYLPPRWLDTTLLEYRCGEYRSTTPIPVAVRAISGCYLIKLRRQGKTQAYAGMPIESTDEAPFPRSTTAFEPQNEGDAGLPGETEDGSAGSHGTHDESPSWFKSLASEEVVGYPSPSSTPEVDPTPTNDGDEFASPWGMTEEEPLRPRHTGAASRIGRRERSKNLSTSRPRSSPEIDPRIGLRPPKPPCVRRQKAFQEGEPCCDESPSQHRGPDGSRITVAAAFPRPLDPHGDILGKHIHKANFVGTAPFERAALRREEEDQRRTVNDFHGPRRPNSGKRVICRGRDGSRRRNNARPPPYRLLPSLEVISSELQALLPNSWSDLGHSVLSALPAEQRVLRVLARRSDLSRERFLYTNPPHRIFVMWDSRAPVSGQSNRSHLVHLDLGEMGSVLLFQIVLQLVGRVGPGMLDCRLVGGEGFIDFSTTFSGYRAGLRPLGSYTLMGRMRGGGDAPPPQPTDQQEENGLGSSSRELQLGEEEPEALVSFGALGALPVTPAPAQPESGEDYEHLPIAQLAMGSNPVDASSPPYRPLNECSREGGAGAPARAAPPVQGRLDPPETADATAVGKKDPDVKPPFASTSVTLPPAPPAPSMSSLAIPRPPLATSVPDIKGERESAPPPPESIPPSADLGQGARRSTTLHLDPDLFDPATLASIEAEVQRRIASVQARYRADDVEIAPPPSHPGAFPPTISPNSEVLPSRPDRAVNFEAPGGGGNEPTSLPPRPRSARAPGTDSQWRHYQPLTTEPRWGGVGPNAPRSNSPSADSRSSSPSPPAVRPTPSKPVSTNFDPRRPKQLSSYPSGAACRAAAGSIFSLPNDPNDEAQDRSLQFWEAEELTTFVDAPSQEVIQKYSERRGVDPAVIALVYQVREQPWRANCVSPHTNPFNPNLERPPLKQKTVNNMKKLADTPVTQSEFKFFNNPRLIAPTEHEQLQAWIQTRAEMCITLRQCVDTRCPGSEFLPAIRDELNRMMGHTQALPQLAALIVQGLQSFVCLASNCLLLACDMHWCPEYSPLTALQTVQRKPGQSLVDCFANIELLMLQAKNKEQEGRDYLYKHLCQTDRQVIPDLHKYAVRAIETGDQPWAREVALAMERACTNARAYARTVAERDRPAVLQLQAIAFTNGIIGLDQNLSLGYSAPELSPRLLAPEATQLAKQPRARGMRGRHPVAPVTTRSMAEAPPPTSSRTPPPPPPLAPAALPQLQHLKPLHRSGRPESAKMAERPQESVRTGNSGQPARQEAPTTNLWIDMAEVARAADDKDPERKRLAIMIWPDQSCKRFAADIECKPTPVFEPDGKPAYFNDGRPMVTFHQKHACRFCSIWAAQPGAVSGSKSWPQEVRDGQHNPKTCPRAIAELLKAGNAGASLLKERWAKNKNTNPEGPQRKPLQ